MFEKFKNKITKTVVNEVLANLSITDDMLTHKVNIQKYLDEQSYLDSMTEGEHKEFLSKITLVANSKALFTVINELMNIQASHSIAEAPTSEAIRFDRAGLNALQLLKDELKRLDSLYRDSVKPEEEFDENEVV